MTKRELLQRIELMPHEADVEVPVGATSESRKEGLYHPIWGNASNIEFVDGKIRLS